MFRAGARGQHHHGELTIGRLGTQARDQLISVHARHLDVEEHQVGRYRGTVEHVQRFETILGLQRLPTGLSDQIRKHAAHAQRVVDDQNLPRLPSRGGRVDEGLVCRLLFLGAFEEVGRVEDEDDAAVPHQGRARHSGDAAQVVAERLHDDLAIFDQRIDQQPESLLARVEHHDGRPRLDVFGRILQMKHVPEPQQGKDLVLEATTASWPSVWTSCGSTSRI